MKTIEEKQAKANKYYDRFSIVYDIFSSKAYYHKPRQLAIEQMKLEKENLVVNLPCGTGQNFEYFQKYLEGSGEIVGIDLSKGMLEKAQQKIAANNWKNIKLLKEDATKINVDWVHENIDKEKKIDAILCDLGLSGFPDWEKIIDNLISILKPGGRIVIMDWYIKKPNIRGRFIQWIGKGEVNRRLWQYLETRVDDFQLDDKFKGGEMFVASGVKKIGPR